MRKLIMSWLFSGVMLLTPLVVSAQEFGPQAGDMSLSLRFGKAVSFDIDAYEVNRNTDSYYSDYDLPAANEPYSINYNTSSSFTNISGVEFKYFVTNQIAVRFSGSGALSGLPSQDQTPEITDPSGVNYPGTTIPGWRMLEGKTSKQFYIDLGADYYFSSKYDRVSPYGGVQFNSVYSQMEIFDGFRGVDEDDEVIPTFDTRRGEGFSYGFSLIGGIDYYLTDALILGIEVKALSYMYAGKKIFHQPGMSAQPADKHVMSFLAQPSIKLGFRF